MNITTKEPHLKVCKVCQQSKMRIFDGLFPDGKNNIWIDESNRQWVGRTCPSCHLEKMKLHMKDKRSRKI